MSTQIVTRATRDAGNSGPAQTSQLEAGCIEQLEQFGALLQLIESALPDTAQAVFARALVTVRGPVFETDLDLEAPAVSAARLASDLNVLELVERFAVAGKQILRVRENFRNYVDMRDGDPPSVAQLVLAADHPQEWMPEYWRRWMEFDYVYVLFTEDEAPNPDPARLKLVQDGDKFQLYRVIKPN